MIAVLEGALDASVDELPGHIVLGGDGLEGEAMFVVEGSPLIIAYTEGAVGTAHCTDADACEGGW